MTKLYALTSGGKDSVTMLHYSLSHWKISGIIYIDTTIGILETKEFVKGLAKKYKIKMFVLENTDPECFKTFCLKYGFPKNKQGHKYTFIQLKWKPLYEFYKKNKDSIFLSGIRKKESNRRFLTAKRLTREINGMTYYAPLFDWTTKQVWDYIEKNNLKVSPVYKKLHISGDCLCGAFAKSGEAELIQMFYPEEAEKIRKIELECNSKRKTWGRHSSMKGVKDQKQLENWLCADC